MTEKLNLRAFLRREVSRSMLKIPTRRKRSYQQQDTPPVVSRVQAGPARSRKDTFPETCSDGEEDFETPGEKWMHVNTTTTKRLLKEKSEIRLQIEDLQKQLLEVIAPSHRSSESRTEAMLERDRLIRAIELLEVQEKAQRANALRATGDLPEPISQCEKKHIQQERERVQKALEGNENFKSARKRPREDNDVNPDLDPDGETRHQLGMSLKRRKMELTGKWDTAIRPKWPELRYKEYSKERLGALLLAGASEEQRGWLGRWLRNMDLGKGKVVGAGR